VGDPDEELRGADPAVAVGHDRQVGGGGHEGAARDGMPVDRGHHGNGEVEKALEGLAESGDEVGHVGLASRE
jgi:hypothetical protein